MTIIGPGITIGPGISLSETASPPPPPPPPPSAPVANFTGTPLSGTQPLTVNFTDSSTNSPTSWAWDFTNSGNTDSTSQNPSYVYSTAGTYSVKLTATNAGGSNSLTRTNYVTVNPDENLPQPQFPNDDFANGISGWTAFNNQVFWSGGTTLAGYPTPTLPDPLPYAPNQENFGGWSTIPTFSSSLVSDIPVESTGQSVSLVLGDGFLTNRGGTPYGPAIFSNYFVAFDAGDYCAFNWRAVSNTDAFSIYAYMVNVDTGATISLVRSTAPNLTFSTGWRTETILVPTAGNYKFVFVSGSWDSTRGYAIGATFYINNIQRLPPVTPGQQLFTTAGTHSWTAPAGVTSVSVACVGGGGGGSGGGRGSGGGGGGLGWKNNITVVPGQTYTVVVGAAGTGGNGANGIAGGDSYFIDNTTVKGGGGQGGVFGANVYGGNGGTFVGTKGGVGGYGGKSSAILNQAGGGGGGGAGGYNNTLTVYGAGGDQGGSNGFNGRSGGGGGGWASGTSASYGGGVGLKGQGLDGVRGSGSAATAGSGGTGQLYGGGGGGFGPSSGPGFNGASGAVRIMWGVNRLYPTFNTADQ